MYIGVQNVDIVKRNSNNFSFSKEILNEVNNVDFLSGAKEFYQTLSNDADDTSRSYLWRALSAITDDVGETIYQNVLNYIQNVSDIDTCTVKSLQSMAQIMGAKYNIFEGIADLPLELANLVDVFSMRRECLTSSQFVNEMLASSLTSDQFKEQIENQISSLNNYRATECSADQLLSVQVSSSTYVDSDKIDICMHNAFYSTIMHFLQLTYGTLVDDKPIIDILSDYVLLSGFQLPNNYQSKIDEYKTKWHISPEFKPEDEVEKIEAGLSTFDNYQLKYQDVLSIEVQREAAPLGKLEPMTRYAYFKEKKVQEYYMFVQDQYMKLYDVYQKADKYKLDNTYLDVTNCFVNSPPLYVKDSGLNASMVNAVVDNLVSLVHRLQDLREYLKSHAQRTYMKGTFLLVSYAVNEYLNQNIYPTLQQLQAKEYLSVVSQDVHMPNGSISTLSVLKQLDNDALSFTPDSNTLALQEYIDQTQYFNIQTDNDILSAKDGAQLNGMFWKNGSTSDGIAGSDTTDLTYQSSKSKIVLSKTFQLDQIADFYENVLKAPQNKISSGSTYVNSFLNEVFSSGADDSWWYAQHQKVMATLSDQTKTIDIDNYLDDVSAAFYAASTEEVLCSFTPTDGTTVQMQLDSAKQNYISRLSSECDDLITNLRDIIETKAESINSALQQLEQLYAQFEQVDASFNTIVNAAATYVSNYSISKNTFAENVAAYQSTVRNNSSNIPNSVRSSIVAQCDNIVAQYNNALSGLSAFCYETNYLARITINNNFDISAIGNLDIAQIVGFRYAYLSADSSVNLQLSNAKYEPLYDAASSVLQKARATLSLMAEETLAILVDKLKSKLDSISLGSFDDLSCLLSSYNFYESTFSILSTFDGVSAALDYTDDEWYKYKRQLFLKYIGQQVGDTPYYYLQNSTHPSYQIHPCLSNFIQKVDFSYPIQNLGGVADSILRQYEAQLISQKLSTWCTEQGYLVDVWNNPLNSNTDYVTRYEHASHVDSNLSANPYFGWDGLLHPKAFKAIQTDGGYSVVESNISVELQGQNLEESELSTYTRIVSKCFSLYKTFSKYDIKQYGLDQYGNSYILLQAASNEEKTLDGTLWFRAKNIPFPVPAFAYTLSSMEESALSNCGFSQSSQSNTYFKEVLPLSVAQSMYMPKVIDFNFTQDNSMLFMNCKTRDSLDIVVFGKIVQTVDEATYATSRFFLQDPISRIEALQRPSDISWQFKCWYTERTKFGAVYVDASNIADTSCYGIYVSKFDRQLTHLNTVASAMLSAPYIMYEPSNGYSLFVDCDLTGSLAVTYNVSSQKYSGRLSTLLKDGTSYDSSNYTSVPSSLAVDGLLSTYSTTTLGSIAVKTLQVAGSTLLEDETKVYKPMQSAGFFLATTSTDISSSGYMQELSDNGILKVQLAVPASNEKAGIDFRHVCPVRQIEGYCSGDPKNYKDDKSYHYASNSSTALCGVLTSFSNVHFLESVYNQYVAALDDDRYYELAKFEQFARKLPDKAVIQANYDYLQLAHYDVSKYLSALRSEETEDDIDDAIKDKLLHAGLVQPYMMLSGYVPTTYKYGTYYASSSEVQTAFKIDRTQAILSNLKKDTAVIAVGPNEQISARWMLHNGKIKLDFNTMLYVALSSLSTGMLPIWQEGFLSSALSGQLINSNKPNERNRLNMFLNLDQPGEVGILNTWKHRYVPAAVDKPAYYDLQRQHTWIIKNISEGNVPKFLLSKVDQDCLEAAKAVAGIELYNVTGFASSDNDALETYLIANEGYDESFVTFE